MIVILDVLSYDNPMDNMLCVVLVNQSLRLLARDILRTLGIP